MRSTRRRTKASTRSSPRLPTSRIRWLRRRTSAPSLQIFFVIPRNAINRSTCWGRNTPSARSQNILARVLGRELQVVMLPEEAWAATLIDAGLPPQAAAGLAELYRADEKGLLAPRGDRTIRTDTPLETTITHILAAGHHA